MNTIRHAARPALLGCAGLALSVLAAVLPFVGKNLLQAHIHAGYPTYSPEQVANASFVWQTILGIIGALAVTGWVITIIIVRRRARYARWVTTMLAAIGLAVSLATALIKDTSGAVGLAPVFGVLLMLPCIVGVFVGVSVWRSSMPAGIRG